MWKNLVRWFLHATRQTLDSGDNRLGLLPRWHCRSRATTKRLLTFTFKSLCRQDALRLLPLFRVVCRQGSRLWGGQFLGEGLRDGDPHHRRAYPALSSKIIIAEAPPIPRPTCPASPSCAPPATPPLSSFRPRFFSLIEQEMRQERQVCSSSNALRCRTAALRRG